MINIHGSKFTDDQLIDVKKQLSRLNALISEYSEDERISAENHAQLQKQAESEEQQRMKAEKAADHKSDQTVTR